VIAAASSDETISTKSRVARHDRVMKQSFLLWLLMSCSLQARSDEVLFQEDFAGKLKEGWSWLRENQSNRRVTSGALEIRVEPGNMWGPANDARNVLVRDLPATRPLALSVTVSNNPTGQYEQVDLVWYYDDSHMVKLGFELVDGKRSIVMGREEKDQTRTIAIIPIDVLTIDLRLIGDDSTVRGLFRAAGASEWREAGRCEPPKRGSPKLSIQCYQGLPEVEHWARISNLKVTRPDK
jgi:regulation of enolase protein 1 (concanavalin A-like superfamily)